MDPNATLARLREILGGDHSGDDAQAAAAAALPDNICEAEELFQALDEWIMKKGALPTDWYQAHTFPVCGEDPGRPGESRS